MKNQPSFLEIVRAPFLFAIIVPLVLGTLNAVSITGQFSFYGFLLASIIGISLHISTNVYNDLYDTIQGADNPDSMKSNYSGGSGLLFEYPDLKARMFNIARTGILMAFIACFLLLFVVDKGLWPFLIPLVLISAFLSKYYTASPFKFAYRGLGEVVVFLGFGPLAILLSSLGQGLALHPQVIALMPLTGLTTLFIVWMGQIVDLPHDIKGGKFGMVSRIGEVGSYYVLIMIHLLATIHLIWFLLEFGNIFFPFLLIISPYPFALYFLLKKLNQERVKKYVASLNFNLYTGFSFAAMFLFALNLLG